MFGGRDGEDDMMIWTREMRGSGMGGDKERMGQNGTEWACIFYLSCMGEVGDG